MTRLELPRLYAILDVDLLRARGLEPIAVLDAWLDAGVRLVQLRAKHLTFGPMVELADAIAERSARAGAAFFVNDRADVARLARAAGVHVGQDDLDPIGARRILAPEQQVGLSTHGPAQVEAAVRQPVDYVAIGPVFETSSKASPDPVVGLAGVRDAARRTAAAGLSLVAIGGITLDSAPSVIQAGADAVAVISDLFPDDWRARARVFVRALE